MQSLQDTVYNWLTIKVVADTRPDDTSAVETSAFFWELLKEEHHVQDINVERLEEMYVVACQTATETRMYRFPTELIDCMHNTIKEEPEKFRNYE
ncbi:hypothetical protein ACFFGV_10500 [Pontibacillus salicampi]|uniref:Uncharacterized protein n=1 Tax=Pontibacillus salicampi TaxID=1449801 RepID=A0ABV6LNJ7_9BACI